MKIEIAICDDNRTDKSLMVKEVERIYGPLTTMAGCEYDIVQYDSGNDLIKNLESVLNFDLLLLDIDMPGVDGLKIAEQIEKSPHRINIIFVTNRNDLVFEAIHYRPFRFVRKEHLHGEMEEALLAILTKIKDETMLCEFDAGMDSIKVPVRDISYLESEGHYVRVHMNDNTEYVVRGKMSEFQKRLDFLGFVRVHVGYLVNIRNVYAITSQAVIMDDQKQLPISRKNIERVKELHASYVRRFVRGIY